MYVAGAFAVLMIAEFSNNVTIKLDYAFPLFAAIFFALSRHALQVILGM